MRTEIGRGVLVSCDAESEWLVQEELRRAGIDLDASEWLETGDAVQGSILLIDPGITFEAFTDLVERSGSIFVRHMAPVFGTEPLGAESSDLDRLIAQAPEIARLLDRGRTFSVQTRILGEGKLPYRKVEVNERLSQTLEAILGVTMDCRTPEQVVSVVCTPDRAYFGVSDTSRNRSAWPGGKHRFKRDDDQVSRAEFKLLEAISVFELELPTQGHALDIGASPGGWTRVLAAAGLEVDAVDPGALHPSLLTNRRVHYVPRRIQEYRPGGKRFAAIVNDMKMDARDSISLMLGFAPLLEPNGVGIITLKMPKSKGGPTSSSRKTLAMIDKDLTHLAEGFTVIGARQLYHNRSEVTVALGPK